MKIQAIIKPNSRHNEGVVLTGDVYEVRVKVPAVEGKANARAMELLAKHFGVTKVSAKLVRGAKSKHKIFEIEQS